MALRLTAVLNRITRTTLGNFPVSATHHKHKETFCNQFRWAWVRKCVANDYSRNSAAAGNVEPTHCPSDQGERNSQLDEVDNVFKIPTINPPDIKPLLQYVRQRRIPGRNHFSGKPAPYLAFFPHEPEKIKCAALGIRGTKALHY